MADRARLLPRAELLHYGIVRAAGGADAGDAVLRVDVAGDRLVEVVNGVDEKIIYFEDVVCYAVDDDDGLGTTWDRDGDDDDDDAEGGAFIHSSTTADAGGSERSGARGGGGRTRARTRGARRGTRGASRRPRRR